MTGKWKVCRTRSKGKPVKRWVAWRIHQKRKSGQVFDTWREAIRYAYLAAGVDFFMKRKA